MIFLDNSAAVGSSNQVKGLPKPVTHPKSHQICRPTNYPSRAYIVIGIPSEVLTHVRPCWTRGVGPWPFLQFFFDFSDDLFFRV